MGRSFQSAVLNSVLFSGEKNFNIYFILILKEYKFLNKLKSMAEVMGEMTK